MKKNIISTALSDEDYGKFMEAMLEVENRDGGKRTTVSKFLRDTVMSSLNGDKPLSVPETKDSIQENVSPVSEDTDSDSEQKQPLSFENVNFD